MQTATNLPFVVKMWNAKYVTFIYINLYQLSLKIPLSQQMYFLMIAIEIK